MMEMQSQTAVEDKGEVYSGECEVELEENWHLQHVTIVGIKYLMNGCYPSFRPSWPLRKVRFNTEVGQVQATDICKV